LIFVPKNNKIREELDQMMPENSKNKEFLQKLAPCIKRGGLDACVEEAGELVELHDKRAIEGYKKNQSNKTYMESIQIVQEHKAG